jgi:hypothetical protein
MYSIGIAINRIVPSWLFRFRIFTVYQIDSKTVLPQSDASNDDSVQVSLAQSEAEISAVVKLTWFQPGDMDADFQSAQAKIDGQLAGAVWAAGRGFDETDLGLRIELTPDQSWIFAALVDGQFRRRGVYSRVLGFMVNHLEQVQRGQQFLSINPTNIASVKAHERYIDSVLGNVVALRVLGVAFCLSTGKRLQPSSWISTNSKLNPILIQLK